MPGRKYQYQCLCGQLRQSISIELANGGTLLLPQVMHHSDVSCSGLGQLIERPQYFIRTFLVIINFMPDNDTQCDGD